MTSPRIALVTPLKNEITNLSELIEKISRQSIPIAYWIIVENGSTDGSKEQLDGMQSVYNVGTFKVINFVLPNDTYALGQKYSTVVNEGFKYLINNNILPQLDYVGILDADCFPPAHYYKQLTEFMQGRQKLGISSGLGYTTEGHYDGEATNWVRGNCRLWKKECFEQAGYLIGPSADTLSLAKAELKGWDAYADTNLSYSSREMGKKVNYSYYGYSAYYRGISPFYALLKSVNFLRVAQPKQAYKYFEGYFSAWANKKERIADEDIRRYFSNYLGRKIKKVIS